MSEAISNQKQSVTALPDAAELQAHLESIRTSAEALAALGDAFPALSKNASRILASLKMMELNVPGRESS